jgi:hypothetical protein
MHLAIGILLLSISLVTTCHSYSTFETTCSTPPAPVNFVSSPDSRGTLDILWSCLFTIVACTWTIQHLNIPNQRQPKDRDHGCWCDFKWALKRFWANLKWMLLTIVAPEFILGKAVHDLAAAWISQRRMRLFANEDKVEWRLAHGLYANMGGFVGISEDEPQDKENQMNGRSSDPVILSANNIYWLQTIHE